jgi:hypothetical protein
MNQTKLIITGVVAFIGIIVFTFINPFAWNDAGHRTVVERMDGNQFVQFSPGMFYAGFFSRQTEWPNQISVSYQDTLKLSVNDYELSDGGIEIGKVPVRFGGGVPTVADVYGIVQYDLPTIGLFTSITNGIYSSQTLFAIVNSLVYGLKLIDEVNNLNPKSVIDLGCGYNEFKGKIQNLIGLDPYNNNADIKCKILDFKKTEQYDVTIALGSINFGNTNKIFSELEKAVEITAPKGKLFFRVNPGNQHTPLESRWISFYHWDSNFIINCADYFNVDVLDIKTDRTDRIYFVWSKK